MAAKWLGPAVLLATIAVPATAKDRPTAFLQFGGNVDAPRGFSEMCVNDREVCDKMSEQGGGVSTTSLASPGELGILASEPGINLFRGTVIELPMIAPRSNPLPAALGIRVSWSASTALRPAGFTSTPVRFDTIQLALPIVLASSRYSPPSAPGWPLASPLVADCPEMQALHAMPAANIATGAPTLPLTTGPAPTTSAAVVMPGNALKAMLKQINSRVNANVSQQSDERVYGSAELWRPSGDDRRAAGDCEDIAIQKRLELIDAKFPADRLFFAVVYRSGVGLHTVLVARLDDGDVVLDSRVNYIQKWSKAGYSWISAQSPVSPTVWRALV